MKSETKQEINDLIVFYKALIENNNKEIIRLVKSSNGNPIDEICKNSRDFQNIHYDYFISRLERILYLEGEKNDK